VPTKLLGRRVLQITGDLIQSGKLHMRVGLFLSGMRLPGKKRKSGYVKDIDIAIVTTSKA